MNQIWIIRWLPEYSPKLGNTQASEFQAAGRDRTIPNGGRADGSPDLVNQAERQRPTIRSADSDQPGEIRSLDPARCRAATYVPDCYERHGRFFRNGKELRLPPKVGVAADRCNGL